MFLSYGRGDDEEFIRSLFERLCAEGFDVWFDREHMPSRSLTFLQEIRDAIRARDRLLITLGPAAVRSDYVRAEWQAALVEGKEVTPILRLGDYDLVPPELVNLHCPDVRSGRPAEKGFAEVLRVLRDPVQPLGRLAGEVPEVPPHFQPRPDDLSALARRLLYEIENPVVLEPLRRTVVLHGMAGVGKSVLAGAFARSTAARRVFKDGVLWIGLSPTTTPLDVVRSLLAVGGAPVATGVGIAEAVTALRSWLEDRRCLVVLDNVWSVAQITPVGQAISAASRLLVTSRDGDIAPGADSRALEVLQLPAALAHLADWVGVGVEELPPEARAVAEECGGLPFALALQGALARDVSWTDLLQALRDAELDYAEHDFPGYPYRHVLAALQVSVDALRGKDPDDARRLLELGGFLWPEGVPRDAVLAFWETHAGLAPHRGRKLLVELERKALLRTEGTPPRVRLHDLMVDYLHAAGDTRQQNEALVASYRARCPDGWPSGPDDGYFHRHLLDHLAQLPDERRELAHLLDTTTPDGRNAWFEATDRTGNVDAYRHQLERLINDGATTGEDALRWTVLVGSLSALAANLPVVLLKALVTNGVWTPERALGYASQVPDPQRRAHALVALLPYLPENRRVDVLDEAVAAARSSHENLDMAHLLAEALAASGRVGEALSVARLSAPGDGRTAALAAVARHLEGADRAEVVAEMIEACASTLDLFRLAAIEPLLPLLDRDGVRSLRAAAVDVLENEVARSWCVDALGRRLVELGDGEEAVRLVRSIPHPASRAASLAASLAAVPAHERPESVNEIVEAVRTIDDDRWRAEVVASFADLPKLLSDFLPILFGDDLWRVAALESVAPHLAIAQLEEVEELLRNTDDVVFAAEGAAALSAVLSVDRRTALVDLLETQVGASDDAKRRVRAAGALIGIAGGPVRTRLLAAAFDAFRELPASSQPDALSRLVAHLLADELDPAFELVDAISLADQRAEAVEHLVPRCGPQHLLRARAALAVVGDDDAAVLATSALAAALEPRLLEVIVGLVEVHPNEYIRARAVALLAPHVDAALMKRLEHLVSEMRDPICAHVPLPVLAGCAEEPRRTALLRRAIEVASELHDADRVSWAFEAMRDQLSPELINEALVSFARVEDSFGERFREYGRARYLTAALPRMEDARQDAVIDEVLALAARIDEADLRRDVLSGLQSHLRPEQWDLVADLVADGGDAYDRAITAGFLVGSAPTGVRRQLIEGILGEIEDIEATDYHTAEERTEAALARILPYTSDPGHALDMVARFSSEPWRRAALVEFARELPAGLSEPLRAAMCELDDPQDRALALLALAANPRSERRKELLTMAGVAVMDARSDLLHDNVLADLAVAWCGLDDGDLSAMWRALSPRLAQYPRPQLLAKIHGLAPVLLRLGDSVASSVVTGILDAERWWP